MKVISFASGKGGVGKTTLVANLGTLFARSGKKTLLVDGDWTLGKLGIALGVRPRWTVQQVLSGEVALADAIHPISPNLAVLASPTGVVGLEELDEGMRRQLFFEIEGAGAAYDRVLLDHSSGVHWSVLQFAAAAHQHVIVTTPEPTSYTDAYAIMKLLHKRFAVRDFCLLVTFAGNRIETSAVIDRFMDVVFTNLDVRLKLLDILPWEPRLSESIRRQQTFVERFPGAALTATFQKLCGRLDQVPLSETHGLRFATPTIERDTCLPSE